MAAPNPMVRLNDHVTASRATNPNIQLEDEYKHTTSGAFQCTLTLGANTATGVGSNKKEAKSAAARELCVTLKLLPGSSTPAQPSVMAPSTLHTPDKVNVKGSLQEMVQKKGWPLPKYTLVDQTGPAHNPLFSYRCVVRNNHNRVVAEGTGESKSKKEAEMIAARGALACLEIDVFIPSPSNSSSADSSPQADRGASAVSVPQSSPVALNPKGRLQEMLQKHQFPIPEYTISSTGPDHEKSFTVKCIVKNLAGTTVAAVFGNSKSKKEAETNAAEQMLAKIDTVLEQIIADPFGSHEHQDGGATSSSKDVEDFSIDDLIVHLLSLQFEFPVFLFEESYSPNSTERPKKLCLASSVKNCRAMVELNLITIVGQGIAETEEDAQKAALLNLIDNINLLELNG